MLILMFEVRNVTTKENSGDQCITERNNVISHCIDKQPCIGTYGDKYNALASGENSYNIRAALYPAKKPSSVNVYGPNGT
ncbi:hypothetical protein pdam_00024573 [Pocillopora damicornis]|uniref:Uncharacterized protein n=1 Tax=Pocillopora damicornis TaxID=46731 RepID=A0A3M6TEQ3_POCDA|nr:hypothetical protein pdam_00024573 [Pocillopora damicornis]